MTCTLMISSFRMLGTAMRRAPQLLVQTVIARETCRTGTIFRLDLY